MFASARPARRWRYLAVLCVIASAGTVSTALLGRTEFFQSIHLKAGDLRFLLRGARQPRGIVLLTVDQKTLDEFHEPLMFWHPYYAEAIRAAADAGARVFGLDITFPIPVEKWEPDHDRMLAQAVIEASARMPVVCGYAPSTLNRQESVPVPLNMAAAALGQFGYVNLQSDPDDFVRKLELIEAPGAEPDPRSLREPALQRSFALRLAERYLHTDNVPFPPSPDRSIVINYAGPAGAFPKIPLYDFLAAARAGHADQIRQWVSGKAVLLGEDIVRDRHATPFYVLASGSVRRNTSGVEIHANALGTLLDRTFLVNVAPAARWFALVIAALAAALIGGYLASGWAAAALASLLISIVALTQALFRAGLLLSASEMILAGSVTLLATLVFRSLTAERRGALFRSAIALFVGKKVARSLDEYETVSSEGSRQTVTILFSDIRGFTAFCEEKDPVLVVELLNDYLRTMVAIIVRHHGHANKFIGDGIMAIFSDEDGATDDHALRAFRCGVEMTRAGSSFRTGVGIHTGVALVGCVGSSDKMEFTALGDTVNLASRLESLNKEHNTQLLFSEATRARLGGAIEPVCLGQVQIRGKSVPMNLYTTADVRSVRDGAVRAAEQR